MEIRSDLRKCLPEIGRVMTVTAVTGALMRLVYVVAS